MSNIPVSSGPCDCIANRCERRIEVTEHDGEIRIEVHGMDDAPGDAVDVARGAAKLIKTLMKRQAQRAAADELTRMRAEDGL